ncbi:TetR/AcrR family transcriptional regulator [Allokutzneria sp. A3M-2-11 16]|uniref:TetR/AcrR family transcriptional regulator n=1 Tax=Allokutzneria sp. A3M-2-11 16 TaxID=2962043 RepID=UPI0020B6EEF3|nr:TetR/AcrR family transcriptional regulator [Allokutzneria sp. A3M-2-11 16]MCP3805551.1 TetR/AcrR family transcriptional regulator [Allokutzneria sp. A3M-2-11 16]
MVATTTPPTPPRADARRNRERVLAAASAAFAEHGLGVPLDEIARRAGVGAGTVHRHFATKELLFEEVVAARFDSFRADAQGLVDDERPAEAFFGFFTAAIIRISLNRALAQVVEDGSGPWARVAAEVTRAVGDLLAAAQRAGGVRDDIGVEEVMSLLVGCVAMERRNAGSGRMTALVLELLRNESNETPLLCAVCGTAIEAPATGRRPRYCGGACRQKAHRERGSARGAPGDQAG